MNYRSGDKRQLVGRRCTLGTWVFCGALGLSACHNDEQPLERQSDLGPAGAGAFSQVKVPEAGAAAGAGVGGHGGAASQVAAAAGETSVVAATGGVANTTSVSTAAAIVEQTTGGSSTVSPVTGGVGTSATTADGTGTAVTTTGGTSTMLTGGTSTVISPSGGASSTTGGASTAATPTGGTSAATSATGGATAASTGGVQSTASAAGGTTSEPLAAGGAAGEPAVIAGATSLGGANGNAGAPGDVDASAPEQDAGSPPLEDAGIPPEDGATEPLTSICFYENQTAIPYVDSNGILFEFAYELSMNCDLGGFIEPLVAADPIDLTQVMVFVGALTDWFRERILVCADAAGTSVDLYHVLPPSESSQLSRGDFDTSVQFLLSILDRHDGMLDGLSSEQKRTVEKRLKAWDKAAVKVEDSKLTKRLNIPECEGG